jgi:hypothetical protein
VFQVNELLECFATAWVGRSFEVRGRVADRDRLAEKKLLGYPEQAFCLGGGSPGVAWTSEVANRGAETLGSRGEEDPFGESALVIRVEIGDLWMDDNGDPGASGCEMCGVGAVDHRQSAEQVPIADNDEFPWLAIAGAARPPSHFEDVSQHLFRQRVRPKLAYSS